MGGKLIVVTGPAAAEKSTIAKGLQAELAANGDLWLLMELDVFGRSLPRSWISFGSHHGVYAQLGFVYERASDDSIELVLGIDGRRVLKAFHRSVAAIAKSGLNVICETILYDDDDWNDWSDSLFGLSACWVKLSAPIDVLEERERVDQTRTFRGLARGMSARKSVGKFTVEADTSSENANAIVRRIVAILSDR
jgi:chloramphenicol 3-O phosphotransferase